MSNGAIYYIHALSALHMGTGAATGAIDLPHSREASTSLPNAPGSGVKGVLRDEMKTAPNHTILFGAEPDPLDLNRDQGALMFSDACLLCFPVRSFAGTFAWISSPMTLARYSREREACGLRPPGSIPRPDAVDRAIAADATSCEVKVRLGDANLAFLHDAKLTMQEAAQGSAKSWAEIIAGDLFSRSVADEDRINFLSRFLVVHDDVLGYLAGVAMDVRTRIAIEDGTKAVKKGGLWSEENLPAESILWGSVNADTIVGKDDRKHDGSSSMKTFADQSRSLKRVQFGGKATVGRGMARFIVSQADQEARS